MRAAFDVEQIASSEERILFTLADIDELYAPKFLDPSPADYLPSARAAPAGKFTI